MKRRMVLTASFAALIGAMSSAHAVEFPAKPITLVLGFAPGGPSDVMARILTKKMEELLKQPVVIENRAGAGGGIAANAVARAAPDGYTVLLATGSSLAINVSLYKNLGYDPEKDFEPVGLIAVQPELLAVRKDIPANNLKEFAAWAKANEAKLNMGHAGIGSVSYIGCLLLNSAIGVKPTLVPFTGTAPVMNAILGGQVDYDCDPVLGPLPHVRAGTVKALAIAAKKRSPLLPDVPTSYEQGFPQFDCAPFYAVFAPKGTPKAVVDKLAAALSKGLDEPAVQKRLGDLGAEIAEPDQRGPKALAALVHDEITRLTPILQAAAAKSP